MRDLLCPPVADHGMTSYVLYMDVYSVLYCVLLQIVPLVACLSVLTLSLTKSSTYDMLTVYIYPVAGSSVVSLRLLSRLLAV